MLDGTTCLTFVLNKSQITSFIIDRDGLRSLLSSDAFLFAVSIYFDDRSSSQTKISFH